VSIVNDHWPVFACPVFVLFLLAYVVRAHAYLGPQLRGRGAKPSW